MGSIRLTSYSSRCSDSKFVRHSTCYAKTPHLEKPSPEGRGRGEEGKRETETPFSLFPFSPLPLFLFSGWLVVNYTLLEPAGFRDLAPDLGTDSGEVRDFF